jgi:dihydrofolate reductase
MKTILWAMLSANGNYAQRFPTREAFDDFASYVARSGNFIIGRKTLELMQTNASRGPTSATGSFGQANIVVLSKHGGNIPGVTMVSGPREAIDYLSSKGHQVALVAGGAQTHNAFLAEHLVDELVFDVAAILESEGLKILLPERGFAAIHLLGTSQLGGGLVQLRYAIDDERTQA